MDEIEQAYRAGVKLAFEKRALILGGAAGLISARATEED